MNQTAIQLDQEVRKLLAQNRRLTQFAQLVEAFFSRDPSADHAQYLLAQARNALAENGIVVVDEMVSANPAVVQAVSAINGDNVPANTLDLEALLVAAEAMLFEVDTTVRVHGYEHALKVHIQKKRALRKALRPFGRGEGK